ncbi:MAG: ImmA/IrrE family metallo-endopeptidase [Alphaproteobacteria bacterium]|nr:ImmA/IrrE family metallo-endopeptidase [Alphaproteobacteria bacterium]
MLVGLHGSSQKNIAAILKSGFVPGFSQYQSLSSGPYAYDTCPYAPNGPAVALDSALAFAREKFPGEPVGCVALVMAARHTLDIQNLEIRPIIEEVAKIVTARAAALGLYIESNSDLTRGASHFALGMFFALYEANFGRPLDVVRARIGRDYVHPVEPDCSHELCVKSKDVIVSLREVRTLEDLRFIQTTNPWQLSNLQRRAARNAISLARALSEASFIDLAVRIAEGCGPTFQNKTRFGYPRQISLVHAKEDFATEARRQWPASVGGPEQILDLRQFDGLRKHERVQHIDEALNRSNGIVAVADAASPVSHGTMSSLLVRAAGRHLPMLVLTTNVDQLPLDIFAVHNVTIVELKPRRQRQPQIAASLEGFLGNRWKDDTMLPRLELMNVARGHCPMSKPTTKRRKKKDLADFVSIVEAARNDYTIAHELRLRFESDRDDVLSDLPLEPEAAAEELRRRLEIESFAVKPYQILRAMNAKAVQVAMTVSGYRIPEGYFGPCAVVALNKNDEPTRQKFTEAHELGHALVDAATRPLTYGGGAVENEQVFKDEERFCDLFAAAFLMPASQVDRFGEQVVSTLADWLDFPDKFEVSVSTAAKRLWQLRRLLIAHDYKKAIEESPEPAATEELLKIGGTLGCGERRSGKLSADVEFFVRRTRHGTVQAVADFRS